MVTLLLTSFSDSDSQSDTPLARPTNMALRLASNHLLARSSSSSISSSASRILRGDRTQAGLRAAAKAAPLCSTTQRPSSTSSSR